MKKLSLFDKKCLAAAISIAREVYKAGDYPVGAVLAIDKKIVAIGGNKFNLNHDNIGLWYKEVWPEIKHCKFSDEPKQLMIKFFHEEIARGNTEWPKRMLRLLVAA